MFLAPLIRWLANQHNPRLAMAVGFVLIVAAIAVAAAGITVHQPFVTRVGLLLMVASIATFVIRSRNDRTHQRKGGRIDQ